MKDYQVGNEYTDQSDRNNNNNYDDDYVVTSVGLKSTRGAMGKNKMQLQQQQQSSYAEQQQLSSPLSSPKHP